VVSISKIGGYCKKIRRFNKFVMNQKSGGDCGKLREPLYKTKNCGYTIKVCGKVGGKTPTNRERTCCYA